jgi:Putative zinc-finger
MTCPRTVALGAYVLGALERDERAELEAHLETCDICRKELDRLAPLPGLLSRLTVEEAEVLESADAGLLEPADPALPDRALDAPVLVDPALAPRDPAAPEIAPAAAAASSAPLERALFEVARERRRSRGARAVALVAAAVLAACAVAGGLLLGGNDGDAPAPTPLTASASDLRTGVHGSAELTREPWGTRVDLRLAGVRPGERCRLVARAAGGRAEVAANWRVGYLGTAEVPGAVAIPADRVVSLDVVTSDDRLLVRMPVTSR